MASAKTHPTKISRRYILQGALVATGAVPLSLIGVKPARAAKATQKSVGYQDSPKGSQSCENCRFFIAPSECKTVEGAVSANGWCRVYLKK